MSNKTHCIVIMYNGKDIPESEYNKIIGGLVAVLAGAGICIPELASVTYKDTEGIASSLARDILLAKQHVVTPITEDPVQNALTYLGDRYRRQIDQGINMIPLIVQLSDDIRAHKAAVNRGGDGDVLLMNALEIISTNEVTKLVLKKYKIPERAFGSMLECYKSV